MDPRHTWGSGIVIAVAGMDWLPSAAWLGLWEQQECPAEVGREAMPGCDVVQVSQPQPGSHFIPSVWSVGYVTVGK